MNILFSIIMLEVLILGLVGLTYTCVQTLFFLNCLNSRRREQRRLEKAYRDSLRKLKVETTTVGGKTKSNNDAQKESPPDDTSSSKENRNCVDVENGKETDEGNASLQEDGSQGRLVTRLVVTSGKEVLPTSHGRSSHDDVKVHKAVVKLSDLTVESEKEDLTGKSNHPDHRYGRTNEINLSAQHEETETSAIGPKGHSGYNITVNSSMIEIGGDEGSVNNNNNNNKEPIYESLDGDPLSILTEVTTICEEQEPVIMDCQPLNKRSTESVSVDMLNGFKQQEMETTMAALHSSPPKSIINVHNIDELQEVQEKRIDIDDVCSTEDELEDFYQKSLRFPPPPNRDNINLVTTISQILCSPPESMELESENQPPLESPDEPRVTSLEFQTKSENHPLESPEPRVTSLEFQTKSDNLSGSYQSHLAARPTDEGEGESRVANDSVGLPLNRELINQQLGESHKEVKCDQESQPLKPLDVKVALCPPRSKGSTWTLPRAGRRTTDGHNSLPRPRGRPWRAAEEAKGKESQNEKGEDLLFIGQTLHRPRSGQFIQRDEAPGGGGGDPYSHFNTCHSTPDMAGAATVPPDTTNDSTHCTTTTSTTTTTITTDIVSATTNVTSCTVHNTTKIFENHLNEKKAQKVVRGGGFCESKNSNSNNEDSDLKLIGSCEPGSTSIHSDDHTDSEESADSLYYTASDHTNSDAYSEIRGDSEASFETVYESIDTPSDVCHVNNMSVNQSHVNMSVNQSEHPLQKHQPLTHPLTCSTNIYEIKNNNKVELKNKSSSKGSDTTDDVESIGSESHYGNISDSDHHRDSGYESPVKADIHSSDDAASTASNSSVENHYEDITPSRSGNNEGRGARESSSRRGRSSLKEASPSKDVVAREGEDDDDDTDNDEARQRQRLQELDDLIAGVPPPDYDVRRPLDNGSAPSDVRASGQSGNIPPPPEFGDSGSGSNDSTRSDDSISGHRHLHSTQSVPHQSSNSSSPRNLHQRSPLLRTTSEPIPPIPPPMPCPTPSPKSSPAVTHRSSHHSRESSSPKSSHEASQRTSHEAFQRTSSDCRHNSDNLVEDTVLKPSEFIRRNSQRGENGSFRVHKKVDRPMSLPLDVAEHYGKIMSSNNKDNKPPSTTQDDSAPSTLPAKPHLTNGKSLPFIPPKFPSQLASGSGLIKPSEYLRSLGGTTARCSSSGSDVKSLVAMHSSETQQASCDTHDHNGNSDSQPASMPPGPLPSIPESTEEEYARNGVDAPPLPPPAPPAPPLSSSTNTLSRSNTLNNKNTNSKSKHPTISVTDLQSVQLRKTDTKVTKTTSLPSRMPLSPEPALTLAKNDVIAELKMSVDITGIKKMKSERAKEEAKCGKIEKEQLQRQFTAVNFVDQIPDTDNAGNRIPDWKRQMLARKAAERAKKMAQEERQQKLEEKRLQSIPPWKRQLMSRRDDDGKRDTPVTPRTQSEPVRIALHIKH